MDLKIKDVAELLNISETTVRRWLAEGKIPAYRLNHQYRFSRLEIENWMMQSKLQTETDHGRLHLHGEKAQEIISKKMGSQAFGLYRALFKGGILEDVPGDTKEEIIKNTVRAIAEPLHLDSEVLSELLLDRERLMPTALNHGIGVPHTRDFLLPKPYDIVTIVYPSKPIEYGALDGQKVEILFFLLSCGDKRHLHLLAKIAHLTRNERDLDFLLSRPKKEELLSYIKEWESKIGTPFEEQE